MWFLKAKVYDRYRFLRCKVVFEPPMLQSLHVASVLPVYTDVLQIRARLFLLTTNPKSKASNKSARSRSNEKAKSNVRDRTKKCQCSL
jgi:hypothetical protein